MKEDQMLHLNDYLFGPANECLFFRISYIVNPKPVTPHTIMAAAMMIYSEPKLWKYTISMLLAIKEIQRRIIPPIKIVRLNGLVDVIQCTKITTFYHT
ncbi:MAG: hypothetical protein WAM14_01845 [Candidatus Nitrosopolaris sp.]